MPKTQPTGSIDIPSVGTFAANAVPDSFDARDLEYRSKLEPLPSEVDQRYRHADRKVLKQVGQSCTGHALAAAIDTILARPPIGATGTARRVTGPKPRVSPYMLYRLARRYDEFPGEADAGSSLRGAFRGWFHHGVALEDQWPDLDMVEEPDLDDERNLTDWRARPLGAFYRVNPYRLDDVQSAITELSAISVSAAIHDGWRRPVAVQKGRRTLQVIQRPVTAKALGGHAFALVGYNEVGFLVQNSWGTEWGKDGFATLPYDDWFDSVYDAWVARPGVPHTPFYHGRSRTKVATGGALATGSGPDLRRLAMHVVNIGNNGSLSMSGKSVSSPAQIERAFGHMDAWHTFWRQRHVTEKRQIVLYAHGGGVDERSGLDIAQRHLNWWLNNAVYPISFVWQSGPVETFTGAIVDAVRDRLPFGGVGFDLVEQFDRLVEGVSRSGLRWLWDEMKDNARRASDVIQHPTDLRWPPATTVEASAMSALPGASLVIARLADYADAHGRDNVVIHLAGHSAGSVFQASMLQRLADAGLRAETMSWMAPVITRDEFRDRALPHIGPDRTVRRFTVFDLSDPLEVDDTIGLNGVTVYHKSILYLVARAFERPSEPLISEVPLVGMAKFWDDPFEDGTLRSVVAARGGSLVTSRSAAPIDGRSDATSHAAFDEDAPTMTSVVMRMLGATDDPGRYTFQAHAAMRDQDGAPWADGLDAVIGATGEPSGAEPAEAESGGIGPEPMPQAAETAAPGGDQVEKTAEPQEERAAAPATSAAHAPIPEVAVAPETGSPILDVLTAAGWKVQSVPHEKKP